MHITVLYYLEKEGDKTPDVVVEQVKDALEQRGHRVSGLGVHGDLMKLCTGLRRRKPDLVFNLAETFGDSQLGLVGLVGLLDLLGLPYTGSGPGEIYIQEDKALTKKLLAFDGVRYPDFAVFSRDADLETGGNLRLPLFVKPLRMDASIGIDAGSLVRSTGAMMKRVLQIHQRVKDSAASVEEIHRRARILRRHPRQRRAAGIPPRRDGFLRLARGGAARSRRQGEVGREQPGVPGYGVGHGRGAR